MSKPTNNQDKTKEVLEATHKIIQKSSDGVYIYRGEPDDWADDEKYDFNWTELVK